MKPCIRCGNIKPLEEFYTHPQMGDKHLGKCKVCCRSDAAKRQRERREYIAAYERHRSQTSHRKAKVLEYQRVMRRRNPEKNKAHCLVARAIRSGKLIRQPCEVCGEKAQAHHDDYSKPLDVRWLCFKHHREIGHGQVVLSVV